LLGPDHKYFSEVEGPAAILPTSRDRGSIYDKLKGLNAKWQEIKDFLDLFSNGENLVDWVHGWWTGCMESAPWTGNGRTAGVHWSVVDQALGLAGARQRWPGTKTVTRRSRGGAHQSTGGGGEAA
jgi:hypothetical protein